PLEEAVPPGADAACLEEGSRRFGEVRQEAILEIRVAGMRREMPKDVRVVPDELPAAVAARASPHHRARLRPRDGAERRLHPPEDVADDRVPVPSSGRAVGPLASPETAPAVGKNSDAGRQ